jgi:TolB-like protein/Tfp pilus assembly protein PilF
VSNGEPAADPPVVGQGLATPSPAAVQAALERVLTSTEFSNAPRLQRFLRHIVQTTVAGRGAELRAYAIAVDVFDRPADFDAQTDSLVRVEAGRLRQKLQAYAQGPGKDDPLRITLPKGGYVPEFETVGAPERPPAPGTARAAGPARRTPAWTRLGLAVGAGLLAVVLVALGVLWRSPPPTVPAPAEVPSPQRSAPAVGVLPFSPLDADAATAEATATVASALTALVTADLVRFRQLFVLAERSTAALAAGAGDPIQAARDAGLDFVVDGTVRRVGAEIVVTVSLIATETGRALWSDTFTPAGSDRAVLDLEREIAGAIATALAQPYGILSQQLARAADRQALPRSLASYECILLADDYYASYSPADYEAARRCLETALEREPGYAQGWAYLAYLHLDDLRYGYASSPLGRELEQAAAAARRAVALEPENAVAQRALAAVLFTAGDLEGFRRHAERALALNPNDSDALADLGGKIAFSGDWEEGLAMRQRAMELNPAHPPSYRFPFVVDAFRRGDDAAALALLDRIDLPDFLMTRLLRAAVLGRHGPPEAAAEAADALLALQPDAASMARDYFGYWHMPPELIDALIDGLGRAGLAVS